MAVTICPAWQEAPRCHIQGDRLGNCLGAAQIRDPIRYRRRAPGGAWRALGRGGV